MGVYLVSASTRFLDEESCWPTVFETLVTELGNQGIGDRLFIPKPQQLPRGSGAEFEEKLIPTTDGFSALRADELGPDESAVFDWSLLILIDFEGAIELPVQSSYSSTTTVRSAQRMLPVASRLAAALDLPDDVPEHCDNLHLRRLEETRNLLRTRDPAQTADTRLIFCSGAGFMSELRQRERMTPSNSLTCPASTTVN